LEHTFILIQEDHNLSDSQIQKIADHKVASFLQRIPYLAGSENPERDSHLNVTIWHSSIKRPDLYSCAASDVNFGRSRVFETSWNNGVDIRAYLSKLLLLIEMSGSQRSAQTSNGKYNPFQAGDWDAGKLDGLKNELLALRERINRDNKEALDAIDSEMTIEEASGAFWDLT
jgi:hypothetical protein